MNVKFILSYEWTYFPCISLSYPFEPNSIVEWHYMYKENNTYFLEAIMSGPKLENHDKGQL